MEETSNVVVADGEPPEGSPPEEAAEDDVTSNVVVAEGSPPEEADEDDVTSNVVAADGSPPEEAGKDDVTRSVLVAEGIPPEEADEDDVFCELKTLDHNDPEEPQDVHVEEVVENPVVEKKERVIPNGFFARRAKCMARYPWYHFLTALVISVALSAIGLVAGNFTVAVDNAGWQSRDTLIADRHTQVHMVLKHQVELATGDEAVWAELENNVQKGWESTDGADLGRRLQASLMDDPVSDSADLVSHWKPQRPQTITPNKKRKERPAPFTMSDSFSRKLQNFNGFEGCDINEYRFSALDPGRLWPVWKTKNAVSALDPRVIRDICIAEQNTQSVLEANNLCVPCSSGRCYPPFSLVLFARVTVEDFNFAFSCEELADAWSNSVDETEKELQECVDDITIDYVDDRTLPDQCPQSFSPTMVDEFFGPGNNFVGFTTSVFQTYYEPEKLYKLVDQYDRAGFSDVVYGAYDNEYEDFNNYYVDSSIGNDMLLAMGSALITAIAVLVHTRSPWITMVGLVQIILSFPLAYFVYTFIARMQFFPFLNFIGVFVVFALGADDIFVAVDKWKNARIDNRNGTVEDIAAVALPDAAGAMFLTTITTAVAFFGTAICPVAPLTCFAVFCGLLIVFDYIMCLFLVLPALCIYDRWLLRGNNFCCSCHVCKKGDEEIDEFTEDESKPSLIRRILTVFYNALHKVRWILLVICIAATVVSVIFASRLTQPASSDVRLLSSSVHYEQAYEWRLHNLYTVLQKSGGAPGFVMWGVKAADTGNHVDPETWSQLVLDDSFDASSTESQTYLLNFCDRFFAEDFADYVDDDYQCPINTFDDWLKAQSADQDYQDSIYTQFCDGATGLPMSEEAFNPCITAWTNDKSFFSILERNEVVQVMYIEFQQRIRFDSPFDVLGEEWKTLESWFEDERASAPDGVNKMFHSSADFWWYDTNGKMLNAAFGAAAIALAFSAVVVLFSSRSFMLTLFSVLTISFVLSATTAMLVASGWTLGFLESVCFAILIGISCDFVIHFCHSYAQQPGDVSRHERTKYALIRMGPSILAAAFTTICASIVMLFTVISFFQQFAQILFYSVIMATCGSFIVFLTLTDCIGPSQPTYLFDKIAEKCCKKKESDEGEYAAGAPVVELDEEAPKKVSNSDGSLGSTDNPEYGC